MMTFRIDHGHKSTALASEPQVQLKPQVRIRQVPEPVRPSKKLPGPRVVEISTALSGQKPVSKESNGKVARSAPRSRAKRVGARAKAEAGKRASGAQKAGTERARTKTAKVLELLKRPGGATLKQLMAVTKWQAHSVRGFLSAALKKKRGLTVESIRSADGERSYSIQG
jgi:Protein of unknown function (DUF3489)